MTFRFKPASINKFFEVSVLSYFTVILLLYQAVFDIEEYVNRHDLSFVSFKWLSQTHLFPLLFFLINWFLLIIFSKRLLARSIAMILIGIMISIVRFFWTSPNVLDPVYFFVTSTICAGTIFFYKGQYFENELKLVKVYNNKNEKLLDYISDGYKYFLTRLFQGWLAFGASLGVSMSILFRSGYDSRHLKYVALKMLVIFIGTSFGLGYWVALPLLNGLMAMNEKIRTIRIRKK